VIGNSYQANFLVLPSNLAYNEDYFSKDDSIIRSSIAPLYDKEELREEAY